jgi:hypothetical protein
MLKHWMVHAWILLCLCHQPGLPRKSNPWKLKVIKMELEKEKFKANTQKHAHNIYIYIYICVCVRVCERERERERDLHIGTTQGHTHHHSWSGTMLITVISHPFLAVGVFHRSYTFGCGVALAMDIVGHRALKSKKRITFISARVVA